MYGCTVHYGVAINVSMKRRVLPFSMSVRLFNVTFHRHTIHNLYLSEERLEVLEHLGEDGLLENMQSLSYTVRMYILRISLIVSINRRLNSSLYFSIHLKVKMRFIFRVPFESSEQM